MTNARALAWPLAALLVAVGGARVIAQETLVSSHDTPPPVEVSDPIEALLAQGGLHVNVGARTLDFWWVKSLPLKPTSTEVAWSAVDEGTLVGAVEFSAPEPDAQGSIIRPGVYTLRYVLEEPEGGRPPFGEVLLLSPIAVDESVSALGHDTTVMLSKLVLGTPYATGWGLAALTDPASASTRGATGRTVVVAEVPVSRDGLDVGTLRFGLMVVVTADDASRLHNTGGFPAAALQAKQ